MKKQAIVVDIDNTVIDTAIRKQSILISELKKDQQEVDIQTIRTDYMLNSIIGAGKTVDRQNFLSIISSENGIRKHPAPVFDGTPEVLKKLSDEQIEIIYLTARPQILLEATLDELSNGGLPITKNNVRMLDDPCLDTQEIPKLLQNYKSSTLEDILERFDILALIGDRPEDFDAARVLNIPFILFKSTLSDNEINEMQGLGHVGFYVASSWHSIHGIVSYLKEGAMQLRKERELYSTQYSDWLGQLVSCV